jgi:integrase
LAALPWKDLGPFMVDLRAQPSIAARALEFAVLTAARKTEIRLATWAEIDMQGALWTVPAGRTKSGREHRVPLSAAALAVLTAIAPHRDEAAVGWLFPGRKRGNPLGEQAQIHLLRDMGHDITAHGFRSAFRDWAAETGQPADIAEAALAHVIGDKTVAAYQRGDLLQRRRALMEDWAAWCAASSNVIAITSR